MVPMQLARMPMMDPPRSNTVQVPPQGQQLGSSAAGSRSAARCSRRRTASGTPTYRLRMRMRTTCWKETLLTASAMVRIVGHGHSVQHGCHDRFSVVKLRATCLRQQMLDLCYWG